MESVPVLQSDREKDMKAIASRREENRAFLADVASMSPNDLSDRRRFIDIFGQDAYVTARRMMVQAVGQGRMRYLKIEPDISIFTIGNFLDQME